MPKKNSSKAAACSKPLVIGLPRAFLYERYSVLWETFFETLGMETLVSGRRDFDFAAEDMSFTTREINCGQCPNNCEIVCVYRNDTLIDSWGNRCEKGALKVSAVNERR